MHLITEIIVKKPIFWLVIKKLSLNLWWTFVFQTEHSLLKTWLNQKGIHENVYKKVGNLSNMSSEIKIKEVYTQ